jgi:hypothetical protein
VISTAIHPLLTAAAAASGGGWDWDWPPFVVGAALGVVAIGLNEFMVVALLNALSVDPARFHQTRRRLARRRATVWPAYLGLGVAAGILGGTLAAWWPDTCYAGLVLLLTVVVPLALLPRLRTLVLSR